MRIQPRQQIFDVWRALLKASFHGDTWRWGGIDGSNSISDTEQLLCLLYPATEIDSLTLDRPDYTAADVVDALSAFGDSTKIPRQVLQILRDYIDRYTEKGEPVFTGGAYLRGQADESASSVPPEYQKIDVLDAYSMSVTLCLAALGFMNVFRASVPEKNTSLRHEIDDLQRAMHRRLTAAMVGLQRSFVVHWFHPHEAAGRAILRTVSQTNQHEEAVLERLRERLLRVRTRLRDDLKIQVPTDADGEEPELFECGWTWGVADDAGPVNEVDAEIASSPG